MILYFVFLFIDTNVTVNERLSFPSPRKREANEKAPYPTKKRFGFGARHLQETSDEADERTTPVTSPCTVVTCCHVTPRRTSTAHFPQKWCLSQYQTHAIHPVHGIPPNSVSTTFYALWSPRILIMPSHATGAFFFSHIIFPQLREKHSQLYTVRSVSLSH